MADRIGPWRELTGDPTLDSIPTEAEMMVEIERRARLKDVAYFDAKIRGEQLLDRVCAQHGHAAYVSWGDARDDNDDSSHSRLYALDIEIATYKRKIRRGDTDDFSLVHSFIHSVPNSGGRTGEDNNPSEA